MKLLKISVEDCIKIGDQYMVQNSERQWCHVEVMGYLPQPDRMLYILENRTSTNPHRFAFPGSLIFSKAALECVR